VYPNIVYDAAGRPSYPSIGDLYSVIEQLANRFKAQMLPAATQIANGMFDDWYRVAGSITQKNVTEAVNIVVDQGEGAIGHQDAPIDDPNAIDNQNVFKHPYFNEDRLSHAERFALLQGNISQVTV
jgi:hypothetical protein